MSTVTYTGEDGPPIPGEPVIDAAAELAELRATVDALLALIAGED
jgi:hypothetical protein